MTNYKKEYKIENYRVLGRKGILVLLDEVEEELNVNDAGVIVPLYEDYASDAGRPKAKMDVKEYKNIGTILQISKKAQEILDEEKMDVKVGSRIVIYPSQINAHNRFMLNTASSLVEFKGYLNVDAQMIQSELID
jgi:hypothetical protein